ncbi:MAG: hypothetical protein UY32_C0002G0028 [Candidatus Jorgensenbacteria bacterium GW2011_GWC1_48_8]|uniref:Uncharacterized protein n=1 Tax=Candidatus Jorgensenbacteria bacterium GW2011_GWC1_48_8 TaxID=1618666 RepID=A0A0G1UYS0_9BACT|nr:MAG: hypothetical protein UY32_C0002G0028 [Candidatus Jorgensenbacteria bacterium GW2011_GWC1_48_8]
MPNTNCRCQEVEASSSRWPFVHPDEDQDPFAHDEMNFFTCPCGQRWWRYTPTVLPWLWVRVNDDKTWLRAINGFGPIRVEGGLAVAL